MDTLKRNKPGVARTKFYSTPTLLNNNNDNKTHPLNDLDDFDARTAQMIGSYPIPQQRGGGIGVNEIWFGGRCLSKRQHDLIEGVSKKNYLLKKK